MPDYDSFDGLLAHLQIQAANIELHKTAVGAGNDEVTEIQNEASSMEAAKECCDLFEAAKEEAFGLKRALFRGDQGTTLGAFPTMSNPPTITALAGIRQRSRNRDLRFSKSRTITQAALEAMDLLEVSAPDISPGSVKPKIKVDAAATNYKFEVAVTEKADADMFKVQVRRMNQETWTNVESGTGKSVIIEITPSVAGQIERLQVRVQLYRKNQPYGEPSDIVYVNVNP